MSKRGTILEWRPKPSFNTKYEKQKYWAEEKRKWVEGVTVTVDGYDMRIPGTLYRRTQEHWIKNRNNGKILRPLCREMDVLNHQLYEDLKKKHEGGLLIKTRGNGLTTDGGCLAEYTMAMNPGCNVLMTSKNQKGILPFFRDKFLIAFDRMDDDLKGTIINRNETKQNCYMTVGYNYIMDNGEVGYGESQLICSETSEKPKSVNNFSGLGAAMGFYDEFPLHFRREELLSSFRECYMDTGTKIINALWVLGGTVEETISNEDLLNIYQLWENAAKWGLRPIFLPFFMSVQLDNDIWINEKKSNEWWEMEAERLQDNPMLLRSHIKNNPRSIQDVFDLAASGRWEEDVADMIKTQRDTMIKSTNERPRTGTLVNMESLSFVNKKDGAVEILEEPKPGCEYVLVVDGVATGTDSGDEQGSSVAGMIIKLFDPSGYSYMPVCIYCERPKSVEASYYMLINQLNYYNRFGFFKKISTEANASTADHFATFLKNNGLYHLLEKRKDLSGSGFSNKKAPGQYVTKSVRDWQMRQAHIFLRKHISSIRIISLLNDMLTGASVNADRLDAWLMFFVAFPDLDKPVVAKKIQQHLRPRIVRGGDGRTRWEWSR